MRPSWNSKEKNRNEILLVFLSSWLYVLSHPPFDFFFLAYFFLIPLLYIIHQAKPKKALSVGIVWGMIAFTGLIYWLVIAMHKYGKIHLLSSIFCLLLLSLYLSLYPTSSFYFSKLLESKFRVPSLFSLPFLWVFAEHLRSTLLTGFPWALLVYSQYNFLSLIQICSYTGPYFISFLLVAINCGIFYLLTREREKSGVFLSTLIFLTFFGLIIHGKMKLDENPPFTETIQVQIVQPSIPQDIKWDEIEKIKAFNLHALMVKVEKKSADLIVWPETAIPYTLDEREEIREAISTLSRLKGSAILLGGISKDKKGRIYNSAFLFRRDGSLSGVYRKVKLVPFGEYTPLVDYFPFLESISVAGGAFSPGISHRPLNLEENLRIGILICYEGIFPEICRETVKWGSQILVNLTNDAWYDRSSAPYQHFSFYVLRAVENERYVIRCANTGISGIIDPRGRIIERSNLFEVKSIFGEAKALSTQTLYSRYGEWFLITLALSYGLILLVYYFRNRSSGRIRERSGK